MPGTQNVSGSLRDAVVKPANVREGGSAGKRKREKEIRGFYAVLYTFRAIGEIRVAFVLVFGVVFDMYFVIGANSNFSKIVRFCRDFKYRGKTGTETATKMTHVNTGLGWYTNIRTCIEGVL